MCGIYHDRVLMKERRQSLELVRLPGRVETLDDAPGFALCGGQAGHVAAQVVGVRGDIAEASGGAALFGIGAPGGLLLIDTPCRDSFYHQVGELTYRLSGGRFPTFLNAMYSSHAFGHKQIFSTREMKELFSSCGLEVIQLQKFHELSFPYAFYLRKLLRTEALVKLSLPLVKAFFRLFKIRNKMLVIGRKL